MNGRIVPDGPEGRKKAVEVLRAGGIVGIPTDTVYGIAVALSTPDGIERLFHAKQRPLDKGIVLLLDDATQAARTGLMTPAAAALAAAAWPGGLTVIVPQRTDVPWPPVLTGGARTIGLRVPDHDAPRALARELGPLPTTSANVSGMAEANDPAAILDQLGHAVDLVLDGGPAHGGPPSTVVDCTGADPVILREGAVAPADVAAILDRAGVEHSLRPGR
jgi:L-threonylcarbamoyladenylate synthase